MPYRIGARGSFGCSGYPALKEGTNEVMGCHKTRSEAAAQIYAINRSEGNIGKSMHEIKEGDFVMYMGEEDEMMVGRVEYVMTNPGLLGLPGSEYSMEYIENDKPVIVRKYEEEDGAWEETEYVCYHRMSDVIKIESLSVSVDLVVEMGSSGTGIPAMPEQSDMENMYNVQIGKVTKSMYMVDANNAGCSGNFAVVDEEGEVEGCFETREQANAFVEAKNKEEQMDDAEDIMEMSKAKKPNYGEMIQPRRGGSTPANPRLYATVVQAAKDKFDVYPSAVANSWVVQEYKRRGGTYKLESQSTTKGIWDGSFNPLRFKK
jgi:hypothetical protein